MEPEEKKKQTWIKAIALTSLGWQLALSIFGGAFLGYYLDRVIGTRYIFTLIFLLIGVLAGYYNLYKYIDVEMRKNISEKNQNQDENNKQ